jgi:hypothetical protein
MKSPPAYDSELAKRLNLKSGMKLRIVGRPAGVELEGLATTRSAEADGVLVFVKMAADLAEKADPAIEAAQKDRIAWIAYPKGGQLRTDLNRDVLWRQLLDRGVKPVRQIALDEVWSAMRFRPA